jgi:1-aminocyclopropane-1-carboxylate deaminase/D-cysteine desulfhydrase-like pyridoxal-dependent ACC family enzyme
LFCAGTGTTAYFVSKYFENKYHYKNDICNKNIFQHEENKTGDEIIEFKNKSKNIEIVAIPCVNDEIYLIDQILELEKKVFLFNSSNNENNEINSKNLLTTEQFEEQQKEKVFNFQQQINEKKSIINYSKSLSILSSKLTKNTQFAKPYKEHYNLWQQVKMKTNIEFDLIYAPRAFEILLSHVNNKNDDVFNKNYWKNNSNIIYYHCGGTEGNISQLKRYKYLKLI